MLIGSFAGALALAAPWVSGCAGTRDFSTVGVQRAPGADGTVHIARQDVGNFAVDVRVENLLPPDRLDSDLTTYAVWFQAPGALPQRVGNLTYNESDRAGQVTATTTLLAFDVIVSGETGVESVAPSEFVVMRSAVEAPQSRQ
jgi:hypothetical protein